jgi:hypothetical protein
MRVQLKPNYILTDENGASNKEPVLVNTETGETFGPMDVFEQSQSYGTILGRVAVRKMVNGKSFPQKEQKLIMKFYWTI